MTTSGDALIHLGPALVVAMLVLAGTAIAVNVAARSDHARDAAISMVRAVVQLAALAAVLALVIGQLWSSYLFMLAMAATASWTSAGRISGRRDAGRRGKGRGARPREAVRALVPVALPTIAVVTAMMLAGALPATGLALIPTAGIMFGGAMNTTSLAGHHAHDALRTRHGEVEAALSLGFLRPEARAMVCRPAAATALIPALDQTKSVGLVTIPGAFVGMVLGGASTTSAAVMQLFVLVALLAVSSIAMALTGELVARDLL